jgi:hypothetical protein
MSLNLSECAVLSGGLVDLEATLTKVADAVNSYNVTLANDMDRIGEAVHAVFDQFKGSAINMPALTSLTIGKLGNVGPSEFQAMGERVHTFVKAQEGTVFSIAKGKGGGCKRIADVVTPAAK